MSDLNPMNDHLPSRRASSAPTRVDRPGSARRILGILPVRLLGAASLLLLAACGDRAEAPPIELPTPDRTLRVEEGWLRGAYFPYGDLSDIALLPDGRVVLLDAMNAAGAIFSPDGTIERSFGGPGDGPGEFVPPGLTSIVVTDSSIVVPDVALQRISEFAFDGMLIATHPMADPSAADGDDVGIWGFDWKAHPEGGLAVRVPRPEGNDFVLRLPSLGSMLAAADTLLILSTQARGPNDLLGPTALWDLTSNGDLVVARSNLSDVTLYRAGARGDDAPVWTTTVAPDARPVTAADRAHVEDLLTESAEQGGMATASDEMRARILASVRMPEEAPRLAALFVTPDGSIWVQHARPIREMGIDAMRVESAQAFGSAIWEVLNPDGTPREVVGLPHGFTPRRFADGCFIGIHADPAASEAQRPARVCGVRAGFIGEPE